MNEELPEFERVFSVLKSENIRFVVIGGLAGMFYGHARVTYDIDICHARDRQNLEALARVLKDLGAKLRIKNGVIPFLADWKTLEMGLNFTLKTKFGDLDLLGEVAGVGGFNECMAGSREGLVAGVNVRILSLDKLISAKRAAGRQKDLLDLQTLETLKDLIPQKPQSEPPTK